MLGAVGLILPSFIRIVSLIGDIRINTLSHGAQSF